MVANAPDNLGDAHGEIARSERLSDDKMLYAGMTLYSRFKLVFDDGFEAVVFFAKSCNEILRTACGKVICDVVCSEPHDVAGHECIRVSLIGGEIVDVDNTTWEIISGIKDVSNGLMGAVEHATKSAALEVADIKAKIGGGVYEKIGDKYHGIDGGVLKTSNTGKVIKRIFWGEYKHYFYCDDSTGQEFEEWCRMVIFEDGSEGWIGLQTLKEYDGKKLNVVPRMAIGLAGMFRELALRPGVTISSDGSHRKKENGTVCGAFHRSAQFPDMRWRDEKEPDWEFDGRVEGCVRMFLLRLECNNFRTAIRMGADMKERVERGEFDGAEPACDDV
ncbi:MAG: hypothetical protein UT33_C0010G0041 [Candidatus Peregrinibacteria bacterium GW2011_GWC2_39_14]|nr:MAG: hypothetical protein US92_C0006G0041 [Candidatus Peregrinibacteria bacterium GW2011_GWA2_38_36]KKR05898.1 MAG: hypothetical protein UT33_C0010G0041 [Candidatus Peregrinibacteria bacterium GW2011_GWC2_39_14]